MAVLILLAFLLLPYAVKLLGIIFVPSKVSVWSQLELYLWCAVGFVVFYILRRFLNRNLEWVETFSHELTHIIVAMLFFRKVHSFNAGLQGGVVETSGKNTRGIVPMSLAPYCLPIFSYLLLLFRPLIDFEGRWIFDILIGMTLCFHFFCFRKQTGSFQTDINQFPLSFSYFYIAVAHLMNFCIIWVAFFPRYNVFTSIWRMITSMWSSIVGLF